MIPTGPFPPRSRERFAPSASSELGPSPNACLIDRLTCREREVLRLLALRYTDREIAETLFISYRTVTTHVANILNKLGVNSRREAALLSLHRER